MKLKGVIPPMITPFKKTGELDIAQLERVVEFLSAHVHGLFICGSYGSGPMMTVEERKQVAEVTKKTAGKDTTLVVHTGTTSLKETLELSLHAKDIGCDAVASVGPYYYTHSEDNLLYFYGELVRQLGYDFPVYVYHNPKFEGYEISFSTMEKLKSVGVKGIKDATFDILTFANYMRKLSDNHFEIALGTEAMWLPACVLGCEAFIPGLANAFPEICVTMWEQGMNKQYDDCRETQFVVNAMRDIMYLARSTQLAVYAMMSLRGIAECYPRAPFVAATEQEKEIIKIALQEIEALK